MSHYKRSRIGKMPGWQRYSTYLILLACACSGVLFFLKQEFHLEGLANIGHSLLVTHGTSSALTLMVFGATMPVHIRISWTTHRNRVSGILMVSVMTILTLTGLLLYYGTEELRENTVILHWLIGFFSLFIFFLHLILGKRKISHDAD
jgi:preprotein translocase subunit SecE